MNQEQIEKVYDLIAKNFRVDKDKVKPEASFENDLNADSLDVVELFIDIEDEFGLDIDIEKLHECYTAEIKAMNLKEGEWSLLFGVTEIVNLIYDIIEKNF